MEFKHSPEIEPNKAEPTDDGFSEKKLARARERFGGKNLLSQGVKQVLRKIRKAKKKEEVSRRDRI